MREMNARYGRSIGGYVWAILDPLGFVLLISIIFSYLARKPPLGESFPLFYGTGYMAFFFYLDISNAVSGAVRFNRPLLTFPRITLIDALIARFILQFLTASFVSLLLLTGFSLFSSEVIRLDPAPIMLSAFFSSLLGLSVASINCSLFVYSESWRKTFGIINRPLFLLSGIVFLYEDMPSGAQDILWWNPLIHVVALMRSGFYPNYDPSFISYSYMTTVALVLLITGILILRVLRREILER
jgi:capsular polysaccharide transport system permease protein